jgi:hypothetical protein
MCPSLTSYGRWPPLLLQLQLQASETLEIARKYRIGRTSHRIASQSPVGGAVEEGAHRSSGPQYRCVGEAEVWLVGADKVGGSLRHSSQGAIHVTLSFQLTPPSSTVQTGAKIDGETAGRFIKVGSVAEAFHVRTANCDHSVINHTILCRSIRNNHPRQRGVHYWRHNSQH